MKDCDALREDLKAYLDGELPLLRRLAAGRHLARCAACREELAMTRRIGNELRDADEGRADVEVAHPADEAVTDVPVLTTALLLFVGRLDGAHRDKALT